MSTVRPTCSKCERLAVVYDEDGKAFCARHGTIFMVDWHTVRSDSSES